MRWRQAGERTAPQEGGRPCRGQRREVVTVSGNEVSGPKLLEAVNARGEKKKKKETRDGNSGESVCCSLFRVFLRPSEQRRSARTSCKNSTLVAAPESASSLCCCFIFEVSSPPHSILLTHSTLSLAVVFDGPSSRPGAVAATGTHFRKS